MNSYESKNFSKSEAVISVWMAKVFNVLSLGLWKLSVPSTIQKIADHPTDDIHKDFSHEDLSLGFKFLADMINKVSFVIVLLIQAGFLCGTIIQTWVDYGGDVIENLLLLEKNS